MGAVDDLLVEGFGCVGFLRSYGRTGAAARCVVRALCRLISLLVAPGTMDGGLAPETQCRLLASLAVTVAILRDDDCPGEHLATPVAGDA